MASVLDGSDLRGLGVLEDERVVRGSWCVPAEISYFFLRPVEPEGFFFVGRGAAIMTTRLLVAGRLGGLPALGQLHFLPLSPLLITPHPTELLVGNSGTKSLQPYAGWSAVRGRGETVC